MRDVKVAIIGGSGLNDPHILENPKEIVVNTTFGAPSDALIEGSIDDIPCVVLARHARNHSIIPSDVNYRANIWALKQRGCTHILASTACGGLQDHTRPGDFVLLDQFIDRTEGRRQTFYGGQQPSLEGVLHMPSATPFCESTREVVQQAARDVSLPIWTRDSTHPIPPNESCFHTTGSALTINGPRFSTRLESQLYRSWGVDLINMTLVPEVVLAREAGMSYTSVAIVTNYDAWNTSMEAVSVRHVLQEFRRNVEKVKALFIQTIKLIGQKDWSSVIAENERLVMDNRQDLLHSSINDDLD